MVDSLDVDIEPTEYHMRKALKDAGAILEFTKSELKKLGYGHDLEQSH